MFLEIKESCEKHDTMAKEPFVNYAQHELIPFVKEPTEVLAFCRVNMVLSNFIAPSMGLCGKLWHKVASLAKSPT